MGMYVWRIVASPCHAVGMFRKKLYRRTTPDGVETLVVVGSFDADGDSEIRVTHALGEAVVDDRIGFYGPGGSNGCGTGTPAGPRTDSNSSHPARTSSGYCRWVGLP
jgi:hypothetical protein